MPDLAAHLDQLLDVLVGVTVAAHRVDVELLQPLLDPLECGRVRPEHPFEQRREEPGPVERARVARARDPLGELLEHRDRLVVSGDDPALADDALERDQLAFLVLVRRVRRDVDVAAVVVEDRSILRGREAGARLSSRPKFRRRVLRPPRIRGGRRPRAAPTRVSRFGRSAMSSSRSTWSLSNRIASLIPSEPPDSSERGRALARPRTANGRTRRRLAARAPFRGIACVNDVLHALALVLELRAREGLPGALRACGLGQALAMALGDLLGLAVERDLRQVSLPLDVDQDADGTGSCRSVSRPAGRLQRASPQ